MKNLIKKNFDCEIDENLEFRIKKEKVFVFKKHLINFWQELRSKNVKVNPLGIYFGKIKNNEKIQLSIEGAQIVGKNAKKNVFEIDDYKELYEFLLGKPIEIKENVEKHNFPILKYKDLPICAASSRENEIISIFPKVAKKMIMKE
ncbi:MAG: NIP7 N-terminal domain-related protein [Candidatus Aenigmatarchaeota archaeon]